MLTQNQECWSCWHKWVGKPTCPKRGGDDVATEIIPDDQVAEYKGDNDMPTSAELFRNVLDAYLLPMDDPRRLKQSDPAGVLETVHRLNNRVNKFVGKAPDPKVVHMTDAELRQILKEYAST